jgi:predicted metal-binding membrane protein
MVADGRVLGTLRPVVTVAGGGALGLWSVGRAHPVAAATLIGIAGFYQLAWFKTRCLRWCRSPLGFLMLFGGNPRSLSAGFVLGARHGAVCFGCCAGLMVCFMGAGVMSMSWLVALAVLMLVEKTHPAGPSLARASGMVLLALGVSAAVVPLGRLTSEATGIAAIAAVGAGALIGRPPRAEVSA